MRSRDDYYVYALRGKDGLIHIGCSSDYYIEGGRVVPRVRRRASATNDR